MSTSRDPAYDETQDDEDLPRTLRRAKQERAAQIAHASAPTTAAPASLSVTPEPLGATHADARAAHHDGGDDGVTVTQIEVPFVRLMLFFLKAVLAAIPALFLLGVLLWATGVILKLYFPWIIQTEILIRFPG